LKGGVAGGSILRGVLHRNAEIEVRPGIVTKDKNGKTKCMTIVSQIMSLFAENNELNFAVPGGLIGIGTKIDPTLTRADRLVGQVLGKREDPNLPSIFTELEICFFLLRRLLGVKAEDSTKKSGKGNKVKKLSKGETLMVNIGSTSTGARIIKVEADMIRVQLLTPVCTSENEKVALSRRVDKHWRLIGWGTIINGITIAASAFSAASSYEDVRTDDNDFSAKTEIDRLAKDEDIDDEKEAAVEEDVDD